MPLICKNTSNHFKMIIFGFPFGILVLISTLQNTGGYPDGAPIEACYSFRPGHGVDAVDLSDGQDIKEFFQLSVTPTNGVFEVVLKAQKGNRPFKGFLIKAIPGMYDPANWSNPKLPMGQWRANPGARRLDCFRGEGNALTHWDNDVKSEAKFFWVPPKYKGKGVKRNVTFVATVVENFERYWTGVASDLMDIV